MSDYYASPLGTILGMSAPNMLFRKAAGSWETPATTSLPKPPPIELNSDQRRIVRAITASGSLHVVHGVTGSGKTHIYLELAQQTVAKGQHVIILLPEIALTAQLEAAFEGYFGERVHLQHSGLSVQQRRELWLTARQSTDGHIWIGTRSSLFLPLENVGLIVLDEFHDSSFKQTTHPKYHSATVAAQLGALHDATIVFGSATPNVRDMYVAHQKNIVVHQLSEPVHKRSSTLEIVDLRDAERSDASIPWLSVALDSAIQTALARHEQVLLFLNRRGNATQIRCPQCGWHMRCPQCTLSLVYHEDEAEMRCHACGSHSPIPISCPECKANDIVLKGYGTKEIERVIAKRFADQRVLRLDQDSFGQTQSKQMYEAMRKGDALILIGTQMLAKGFDLPHLSTVGIVDSDTMLQLPDFSASERTFQLITQVMGRGGRRGQLRRVVLQTYQPEHPVIQAAAHENYHDFYQYELEQRRLVGFPPFRYLLKLSTKSVRPQQAIARLQKIVDQTSNDVSFLGPAPAFHERIGRESVWQLSALSSDRKYLVRLAQIAPTTVRAELDPLDLL